MSKGKEFGPEPQSLTAWFFAATGLFATETQTESDATGATSAGSADQQKRQSGSVQDPYEEYAGKETGQSFGI